MLRMYAVIAALLLAAGLVAGCGGESADDNAAGGVTVDSTDDAAAGDEGEDTGEDEGGGGADTEAGMELFVSNCGSCHTLDDAGTTGAVGPELSGGGYSPDFVAGMIAEGGGGMPPSIVTGEDAEAVAAYVAEASS